MLANAPELPVGCAQLWPTSSSFTIAAARPDGADADHVRDLAALAERQGRSSSAWEIDCDPQGRRRIPVEQAEFAPKPKDDK
jgi:hypothetical protein